MMKKEGKTKKTFRISRVSFLQNGEKFKRNLAHHLAASLRCQVDLLQSEQSQKSSLCKCSSQKVILFRRGPGWKC